MKTRARILLWLALVPILVGGLARLRFDADPLSLLPGDLPVVYALKLYQKHFANDRELIVTARAPDSEAAETAVGLLAAALGPQTGLVASATWQPPWNERPGEMARLIAYLWLNQPPEELARLAAQLAPENVPSLLQKARADLATSLSPMELGRLSYDPLGFTRLPDKSLGRAASLMAPEAGFASPDGTFRALFVEAAQPLGDYRAAARWLDRVKSAANTCQAAPGWPPNVAIRYTGGPAFLTEIATGMERDMRGSALATLGLIAILFWLAHRSLRPLLWLLAMLGVVVAGTLAAGGLVFGTLSAVSLGFAAILMGLAVDYGLVLYEESRAAPGLSAPELRQRLAGGIVWSAVTTAGAFALLNFGGLPGLGQLGSLVAIGVMLAALVMLHLFLPAVLKPKPGPPPALVAAVVPGADWASASFWRAVTGVVVVAAAAIVVVRCPRVDASAQALQPRHRPAQTALAELQKELGQEGDPLIVLVAGADEQTVARRLDSLSARLVQLSATGQIQGSLLPGAIWPHPDWQRQNQAAAAGLTAGAVRLRAAAAQAGFTSNSLALAEGVLAAWDAWSGATNVVWPSNASGRWLLNRASARTSTGWLAAGVVHPATTQARRALVEALTAPAAGQWATGWGALGQSVFDRVEHRVAWLVAGMLLLLAGCLWMAFGCWREAGLSFATLGLSGLVLLAVMGAAGWSWNLMNLMALPLLLGAGVDYTIHVQLALRRHNGEARTMRRVTGRAVFLCAATTVAGFGSNAGSSNAGLASLGLVCGAGIAAVYLCSVFLLPAWWQLLAPPPKPARPGPADPEPSLPGPPSFYGARVWRAGLFIGRVTPRILARAIAFIAGDVSFLLCGQRRKTVFQNLLPVLDGDRAAASAAARRLFRQFAIKVADLLRYESGRNDPIWETTNGQWNIFDEARGKGRGVLLVTPHLGNWEFGAELLARHGVQLLVLTQREPDPALTELRRAARARRGVETLVVGGDAFAFIEIIQRLQAGETVALLLDRPPGRSGTTVELFGRPFQASLAAAELARASGCAVVGVTVVRTPKACRVDVLPEFAYDRAALGNREARRLFTGQIMRAFEPAIRKHPDQWYHFVPVWPAATTPPSGNGL